MKVGIFYVRPSRKMSRDKARQLVRFCGTMFVAVNAVTAAVPAFAATNPITNIAAQTFGPGGPGVVIISLLLIALIGWLAGYIAQAVGKGQIAGMIHIVTVFSCITIVANTAWGALSALGHFMGIC